MSQLRRGMRVRFRSRFPACRAFFFSIGLAITSPSARSAEAAEPPQPPSAPDPIGIDLGVRLGFAYRVGDAPAFSISERAGASFGVSAYVSPRPTYALGLAFEHVGLGR